MSMAECNYGQALENFIMKMVRNTDNDIAVMTDAMKDICELLKIARVNVELYKNISDAEQQNGDITTVYDNGNADLNREAAFSALPGDGTIAGYRAYQQKGDEDWDEKYTQKAHAFLNTLHVFCDRSRLMKVADYLAFHDNELETYNIAHFVKL